MSKDRQRCYMQAALWLDETTHTPTQCIIRYKETERIASVTDILSAWQPTWTKRMVRDAILWLFQNTVETHWGVHVADYLPDDHFGVLAAQHLLVLGYADVHMLPHYLCPLPPGDTAVTLKITTHELTVRW